MGVPQVVIVGRPNVGKSSLFNWLAGRRIAIVDDKPGMTRDRMSQLLNHDDRFFDIIDTGGMGHLDVDNLTKHIEDQITVAIDSADVILFVVDARSGMMPIDGEIAKRLRQLEVPTICIVNKADDATFDAATEEYYRLGFGTPLKVSTLQNRNRPVLLNQIVAKLPPLTIEDDPGEEPLMKVAIVGRRNVGKSTFVNTLAEAERMIVSEIPGTTRDSVDVKFDLDGKSFIAIDTPGLRKTKSRQNDIDFYGTHRAQRSIRRADVVLLFLDASERIGKVDKQLCDYISEEYKPIIFVVNKWDLLAKQMPTEKWVTYLHDTFRTTRYAPIAFITAQTGKNVKALMNHAQMLFAQSRMRVSTGTLNRMLREAVATSPPPMYQNRRPKIFYATQVATQPPTLVLFCSQPAAFSDTYRRYLLNTFRDQLDFAEVPIKLYLRKRTSGDETDRVNQEVAGESN